MDWSSSDMCGRADQDLTEDLILPFGEGWLFLLLGMMSHYQFVTCAE